MIAGPNRVHKGTVFYYHFSGIGGILQIMRMKTPRNSGPGPVAIKPLMVYNVPIAGAS
jgi:hypothetical protein